MFVLSFLGQIHRYCFKKKSSKTMEQVENLWPPTKQRVSYKWGVSSIEQLKFRIRHLRSLLRFQKKTHILKDNQVVWGEGMCVNQESREGEVLNYLSRCCVLYTLNNGLCCLLSNSWLDQHYSWKRQRIRKWQLISEKRFDSDSCRQ